MSKFDNLKPKQVLSEASFYIVEKVVGNKVQLKAEDGQPVILNKGYVDSYLNSADQFLKEEKVTRTELAEIVVANARTAMTVNFNKQVKEVDVVTEIENVYQSTAPKDISKAVKAAVKKAMNGEERTIIGRHYGTKDDFGRINFVDMGIERDHSKGYDNRLRLIDTRTINWLIVNDIKYSQK